MKQLIASIILLIFLPMAIADEIEEEGFRYLCTDSNGRDRLVVKPYLKYMGSAIKPPLANGEKVTTGGKIDCKVGEHLFSVIASISNYHTGGSCGGASKADVSLKINGKPVFSAPFNRGCGNSINKILIRKNGLGWKNSVKVCGTTSYGTSHPRVGLDGCVEVHTKSLLKIEKSFYTAAGELLLRLLEIGNGLHVQASN